MGHGKLSGCPFHLTTGWTNDMTVSYSELHRWERENEKKKKVRKTVVSSGGRSPGIELDQLQKVKFSMPLGYRKVKGELEKAAGGTWVFSTAFAIGFFTRPVSNSAVIQFKELKKVIPISVIRKALDSEAICFVEKQNPPKQRKKLKDCLLMERDKIFHQVNFVDPSCFKPGRLRMGQEVINPELNVGQVCFRSASYVKVRFGRQAIRYTFPVVFMNGELRLWGGYHGIGYSEKGQRMIRQRKQELQRMIDRFHERIDSLNGKVNK